LISELSSVGNLVVDPFMGSGTALVESKVSRRPSFGVDKNPVAPLIAKVKTTAIEPGYLASSFKDLERGLSEEKDTTPHIPEGDRIDFWFLPETQESLGHILSNIQLIDDGDVRDFFLCGFSHILKNTSVWKMSSSKPTRDKKKRIPDPYRSFARHLNSMLKKNQTFYELLEEHDLFDIESKPRLGDSRDVPIEDGRATLVVTSPPYVTSYEYIDLHQLSLLWLENIEELSTLKKTFICSSHSDTPINKMELRSDIADRTVARLESNESGKSKEVARYFSDMLASFKEMHRYLRTGGHACIVIGDTKFKGVEIPNAEVFTEQMRNIGFSIHKIIKREIPSKILPQIRDPKTGRFTSRGKGAHVQAYPHEYIVVMEKE